MRTRWTMEDVARVIDRDIKRKADAQKSKYGNKRSKVDGITFDSKKEARRYEELKLLERQGSISGLRLQVHFELAPRVYLDGRWKPPLRYIADFVYLDEMGRQVVEDAKGYKKKGEAYRTYRIKKHLVMSVHGIEIIES